MLHIIKKDQKGFSLVELLVALSIITTTVMGIFSLIILNIQAQVVNKEFLVAAMLAQEGLEIVRNSRDENWRDSGATTWEGIVDGTDGSFVIDYNGDGGYNIPKDYDPTNPEGARLCINSDGFYEHDDCSEGQTIFYRIIEVDDSNIAEEYIELTSTVTWEVNGTDYKYVADTLLYDWR